MSKKRKGLSHLVAFKTGSDTNVKFLQDNDIFVVMVSPPKEWLGRYQTHEEWWADGYKVTARVSYGRIALTNEEPCTCPVCGKTEFAEKLSKPVCEKCYQDAAYDHVETKMYGWINQLISILLLTIGYETSYIKDRTIARSKPHWFIDDDDFIMQKNYTLNDISYSDIANMTVQENLSPVSYVSDEIHNDVSMSTHDLAVKYAKSNIWYGDIPILIAEPVTLVSMYRDDVIPLLPAHARSQYGYDDYER